MLNLLIISGLLVGCAETDADFDSFSAPKETTQNLNVPTAYEFTVKITDGTEGRVDMVPYAYSEGGLVIGKTLSSAAIVDGQATIGLPASAPKRDLVALPSVPVTYALVMFGEEGNVVGIASSRVVFSRIRTAERTMGWNLGQGLGTEDERFMSIHSPLSMESNLVGPESISFQVTPEVESSENQQLAVIARTDRLYESWDSHLNPGLQVAIDGPPVAESFGFENNGIAFHQSIGIAYRDENSNGAFDLEEPIDGMFCQEYTPVNLTYIDILTDVSQAMNMEIMNLKTGWQVTQETTGGTVVLPDTAAANLRVQDTCSLPQ